jgi:hypothetical protein
MKIITDKNYKDLKEVVQKHRLLLEEYAVLESRLQKANDLKDILTKLTDKTITGAQFAINHNSCGSATLPDNVLVYVDDILGGKVIKQEGVKAISINSKGEVKTGLTKQKADKGYNYKLVRESQ